MRRTIEPYTITVDADKWTITYDMEAIGKGQLKGGFVRLVRQLVAMYGDRVAIPNVVVVRRHEYVRNN